MLIWITLAFSVLYPVECYKILIFSAPTGFSHTQFTRSIIDTIADAGHNVTVLMPLPDEKTAKMASPKARYVFVDAPDDIKQRFAKRAQGFWKTDAFFGNLHTLHKISNIQVDFCDYLIGNMHLYLDELQDSYDVAIADLAGFCAFGIFHKLQIRSYTVISAIGFVSTYSKDFQVPIVYSYMPASLLYFTDRMSFLQRTFNAFWHLGSDIGFHYGFVAGYLRLFVKYGIELDINRDINGKTNYYLVNTVEHLDYARPNSGKMKYIGGIAVKPAGNMPAEFDTILNKSKKGTIAISFGSFATTSDMLPEMKKAVLDAVQEFSDYQFIWRVDKSDLSLSNQYTNLKTVLWLPQRELLNDARVKIFIGHAGMNSVLETAISGKPSILVPIFGDQFQNAGMMSRLNSSKILWKESLKGDAVIEALRELLQTDSYAKNGNRIAELIKTEKLTPNDVLLQSLERTARFGKIASLDNTGYEMNFIQYYSVDVFAFYALIIYIFIKLTQKLYYNTIYHIINFKLKQE